MQIADSARKMMSYPWRHRHAQLVQFGVSGYLTGHFGSGQKLDELRQASTGLTRQVRDLAD